MPRVSRSCFAVRGSSSFVPRVSRSQFAVCSIVVRGSYFVLRGSQFHIRFAVLRFTFVLRVSTVAESRLPPPNLNAWGRGSGVDPRNVWNFSVGS